MKNKPKNRESKNHNSKLAMSVLTVIVGCAIGAMVFFGLNHNSSPDQTKEENYQDEVSQNDALQNSNNNNTIPGPESGSHTGTDTRLTKSTSDNSVRPSNKVCYLTFDDGPSSNTERILDILNKYKIKGTWFVKTDNAAIRKAKTIWDNGNQVAVHTSTHDYKQIYSSANAFWADHDGAYATLTNAMGVAPAHIFRFPGGSTNSYNKAIASTLLSQAAAKGEHFFDWNQSCGDGATHTADEIVGFATNDAATKNSVCLLMHDSDAKNTTVEALERIIQFYKNNGFTFEYLVEDSFGYHL